MIITKNSSVGIIGGRGKTGSQFARIFSAFGCSVRVTGEKDKHRNTALIASCDVLLFALPLSCAARVIQNEVRFATRTDQLVLDVSSLKSREIEAMLGASGEVVGMHPLFGPSTDPRGETVILCPARTTKKTLSSLRSFFRAVGVKTLSMDPATHDSLMGTVQVIPHLKSFLMADVLRRRKANLRTVLRSATPTYELEFNVIGRFLDDHPDLYMPIIFRNPEIVEILKAMQATIGEYLNIAQSGAINDAEKRYEASKKYFRPFLKRARRESEACIRTLLSLSR